jgi:hypothetical protein
MPNVPKLSHGDRKQSFDCNNDNQATNLRWKTDGAVAVGSSAVLGITWTRY